jgi:hypothetical protein
VSKTFVFVTSQIQTQQKKVGKNLKDYIKWQTQQIIDLQELKASCFYCA